MGKRVHYSVRFLGEEPCTVLRHKGKLSVYGRSTLSSGVKTLQFIMYLEFMVSAPRRTRASSHEKRAQERQNGTNATYV